MSFLIDPPWLYANGRAAAAAGAATTAAFWAVSVSLYLDRRRMGPIRKACRAGDGRDHRNVGAGTPALSAALFASAPLWLWRGR